MSISRRTFLGGVLVVSVPVALPGSAEAAEEFAPNVFVRLDERGRITATAPKPDSGQGVRTMVALLVAEELAVGLDDVRLEQAHGDTARFGYQGVGNSFSARQLYEPMRRAAATARCLLVAAAARRWGVPVEECSARDGAVHHGRRVLRYGSLVRDAAALDPATVPVTTTPPERWRLLGRTRAGGVDAKAIVTGRARYGIDTRPPGALVAVVLRPQWIGALVDAVDDSAARAVPGVVAVTTLDPATSGQGGVAVIARSVPEALRGREALRVTWRGGTPTADSRQWLADLEAALPAVPTAPGPVAFEATYRLPLLAHAPMEPMNATAHLTATGLTVWTPTQDPGSLRQSLAGQLGLDQAAVRVEPTLTGGAFGRRIEPDPVLEAVGCSRVVGAPVSVLWTRDDDMRHDSYRPMSVHRLSAVLDASGMPTWRAHGIATWPLTVLPFFDNPAIVKASGDHFPYAVPGRVDVVLRAAPLRTGFWRAVYAGHFQYAEENFLSELGHRAGLDQVDLRRRLLPADSRLRRALDAAAARAGTARPGSSRGVACHDDYGSVIAVIADASEGRVRRVTAAVDVGPVLHPSGVRAQVEGGVMDALSTVSGAQITVRDGRVVQSSFRDYAWARIDQAPDVDVVLVRSDAPIGGLGELAYPPAAAAIAFATGRPVTGMPVNVDVG
ncbi:xanthine dehydrogenase family protein molybdopterin-binding subunit [Saccharothrix luteola]|uniref:xanthine dehydrogenase family protein molybdopterin-binding subunit n=1 Tax=Saccharothrix luteola TaxID=2893018 RepID=UPI001E6286C3|nr:molybdopterin cofactor-binding domain-containing protein [Saccharothrix luteola]MCC8247726.1 molybdopterin-dependent oxidoreductase [Saccharothrix luteola]